MAASSRSPADDGEIVESRAFSLGKLLTPMPSTPIGVNSFSPGFSGPDTMAASSRSPADDGKIVESRAFSLGKLLTAMGVEGGYKAGLAEIRGASGGVRPSKTTVPGVWHRPPGPQSAMAVSPNDTLRCSVQVYIYQQVYLYLYDGI